MKLASKKLLLIPAVAGLVLVPRVAIASRGADDANRANDIRREDRREDRRNDATQGVQSRSDRANEVANGPNPTPKVDDNPSASDLAEGSAVAGASTSNSSSSSSQPLSGREITLDQAKAVALSQYGSSSIKKVEIEMEHGAKVYSVRFVDGSRVDVSASDGTVTRTKIKGAVTQRNSNNDDNDDRRGNSGRDHSEDD